MTKARGLYNGADYDGAIAAATEARQLADWADAAAVVLGRAYLERYRQRGDAADLDAGRDALRSARAVKLTPRDFVDQLVGVGQCLYYSDDFGAGADIFEQALAQSYLLAPRERLLLLDWWASALDRAAQARPSERRAMVYQRLLVRMEDELRRDPSSPVANYWLAVSARGVGDVDGAWDAATAGWVRSGLSPETAYDVRGDLDRFVTEVLVTEVARLRKSPQPDDAARRLREQWEAVKQQWPSLGGQ